MHACHTTCLRDALALLGTPTPEDDAFCTAHFWDSGCDFLGGPLGPEFVSADTGLHDALTLLGKPISAAETVGAISACEVSKNNCHRDTALAPFQALTYSDPFSACGSAGAAILDEGSDFLGNPICTTTCAAASWSEGPAHSWDAGTDFLGGPLYSFVLPSQDHRDIGSSMIATKNDEQDPQRAKTQSSGRPTPRGLLERRPVQGPGFTVSGPPALEATLETRPEKGQRSHEVSFPNLFPDGAPTSSPERAPMSCPFASQCVSHGVATVAGCPGLLAEVLAYDDFGWKDASVTKAGSEDSILHTFFVRCPGLLAESFAFASEPVVDHQCFRNELTDSTVQCMCNARPLGFKPLPLDSCQVSACSCAACLATPFGFRPSPLGPRKTCLCSAEPEGATEAVRGESLSHLAGQHVAGGVSGQGFSFEMRCTEHCACCAEAESVTAVPPCPRTIAEEPDCHSLVSGFGANIICEHAFSSTLPHAAFSAGRSAPCARRARCGHEWSRDPGISHQGQASASVAAHEPQLFACETCCRCRCVTPNRDSILNSQDPCACVCFCAGRGSLRSRCGREWSCDPGISRRNCCDHHAEVYRAPCTSALTEATHELDYNHLHGCRIGEASHPGPGAVPLKGCGVHACKYPCDAVLGDASVITWGRIASHCEYQVSSFAPLGFRPFLPLGCCAAKFLSRDVQQVHASKGVCGAFHVSECAFGVILGDASVITWGHACSAKSSGVQHQSCLSVALRSLFPGKLCSRSDMRCTANVFGGCTQVVASHIYVASDVDGENGSGLPVINFCGNNAAPDMVDDECYRMFSELSFSAMVQSFRAYPDSDANARVDFKLCSCSGMRCTANVFGGCIQLVASHIYVASNVDGENGSGPPVINFCGNNGYGMIADCSPCTLFSRRDMRCTANVFGGRTQVVASHIHQVSDVEGENGSGLPVINFCENNGHGMIAHCSPRKLCSRSGMQCTANVFGGRTQLVASHMHLASDVNGENGSGLPVINFCGNNAAPDMVDDECYRMFSELSFSAMVQSFRAYPDSDANARVDFKLCSCSGMRCTANVIGGCIQLVASHIYVASDVDGENGSGLPVINFCGNNGYGMIADCSPCTLFSRRDMRCTANVFGGRTQVVASHIHQVSDVEGENGSGLPVINFCENNGHGMIAHCSPRKLCSRSGMQCTANVFGGRTQLVASHMHLASDVNGENGSGLPVINFSGNNGPGMIADCSPYKSPCAHYKNRAAVKSMMGNFVDGQNAGFTLRSRLKVDDECYHIFSELSFNTLVQSLPAYPDSEAKTFVDCKLCSRSDMQCADSVFGVRTQLVAPYMPLASDVDGENDSGLPVINFVAPDIFDDECYRMFSELSFSTMVQSFPAYPDSETKAYVDCKLCSRSDMQCTASVFGVRTQLVAPHMPLASDVEGENGSGLPVINFCENNGHGMIAHCSPRKLCSRSGMQCTANVFGGRTQLVASHMHLASDVNGENGSGLPVINFSGNNGPGMIADCSPYKSPCAHYKNRAAVKSMMGNFVDGQNAGFTLRSRLKVDDECYHIFSELSFNTLVQSLPAYPDSEAKTFVDCKLCSRSDMQCADSVFGVRTQLPQLVAPYMPLASDVDGENDSGLPVINFVAPDIFDDECYRMFSELSFSIMVQSFPAYPDSETKDYVDCKLCSRSDMQCTDSVFGVRTQLVAPHMPLASDVDGENGSGLPVINFCGNDVAPDIVDDECYCMFSELSFSTMVQSFRAYPDGAAKAYVDSKLCSCSGMRCTVNVIGCCIQLVASHIHQASDVDGENGSGPPVINFCGNNGRGMIADCSPYKSPCACFKNRVPLRVPLFPCADGDLATFRFRLCPFGFRCWMPVFNSACQVACSVQHSINQAACEVSCDQFSPRLDAHATLGLSAFTIAAHRAPCTSALTEAMHELDHNHLHGCRIGEASHPGPGVTSQLSFLGPEFAKQIQAQIEAAVQAAVMQALSQLNIPGLAAGALSATRPRSHGDAQKAEAGPGPKKRKRKRKGKAKDAAAAATAEAEAPQPVRRVVVAGDDTNKRQGHRPDAGGRGKGKGGPKPHKGPAEPADDGWQLVRPKSRRDQDGEFTLRAEDWSAPIVEFSKLATFLDDAMAGTTLEAVVYIKPEQKEVAANLIRGAGSPYKFLLIYLDKKEGCRTPGMIDGKLVFRQAVVTRISSDQNLSGVPQPKGITANAVKIQPATETAVLFMKVYKNYASADFWKRFGSNPNRSIVHWASQHRMRILDAFAWATEKGRADVGELYGGMARVRKSDLEGFLQLSGTQGIFIDTARRHGIQSKVSWVDRMSGETPSAYHERALRQGSDLGLVTNANRLGWRKKLAAGETEQRLWQVDGLPFEWDDEVVKQLLESNFGDITIMSHRRTRLGQNFRFKAASRQEGRDIVPLVAEDAKKKLHDLLGHMGSPCQRFCPSQAASSRCCACCADPSP